MTLIKPPLILKTILDVLFVILIFSVLAWTAIGLIFWFLPEDKIPFAYNKEEMGETGGMALDILGLLGQLLFVYVILKFRSAVRLFFEGEIYSQTQVKNLKNTGRAILLFALIDPVPNFIYKTFLEESPRRVEYSFGFDSFLFVLALGLFFVFLSRIFENAQLLKEENDLTV